MATQIPTQTGSFFGIYTIVEGVLTPGPLDLSFHLPNLDGLYFDNIPNRTLLVIRSRMVTEEFYLTLYPVGLNIPEPPDELIKAAIEVVTIKPGQLTVIGPFSTNFNDANNHVNYLTQADPLPLDLTLLDLVVIVLPE